MSDFYGKNTEGLKQKRLFLFDMDGTIYTGNRIYSGVKELLLKIESIGGKYVFITNNSSKSVSDYIEKLKNMGIDVNADNFFTSAQAAIMLMREKFGNKLLYCQGTKSFINELQDGGLNVTQEYDENAVCVLVAFDPEITGKKLENTCKTLMGNVEYYATNPDKMCPTEFGGVPDCGSMCIGIEYATGKRPIFIGKPEPTMIFTVMRKFGFTNEETLVIGDRLYTDIQSGVNAGVDTVCVLSGEATESDVSNSEVSPTYVLRNVSDMVDLI